MSLISFDKPKKVKSIEEWKEHSFDGGPAGGYVPNMSDEDMKRWKGKHIKGDNERIEIRKLFPMAQVVIVVRKHPPAKRPKIWAGDYTLEKSKKHAEERKKYDEQRNNIKISMNGSLWLSTDEWAELTAVVAEAQTLLKLFSI